MRKTISTFLPDIYKLSPGAIANTGLLEISGHKIGAPSSRLTLNQKGLRVTGASITYHQKNKVIKHQVIRINHLPRREEVRLHTSSPLYPGTYEISIEFKPLDSEALAALKRQVFDEIALRDYFPSFDNPHAKQNAKLEISQSHNL